MSDTHAVVVLSGDRWFAVAHPSGDGLAWSTEPHIGAQQPGQQPPRRRDAERRDTPAPYPNVGGLGPHKYEILAGQPDASWCAVADADSAAGRRVGQGSGPGALPGTEVAQRPAVEPGRLYSGSRPAGAVAWGEFEPAIRRWEATTGVLAPAPTDDRSRLSPEFVEWMVGMPAGWTDVGISRTQRLKCLGNIAMPMQAAAAYGQLLSRCAGLVAA